MESLNIIQLSIILDWPKDRCRYHFQKIEELPAHLLEKDKKTGKMYEVAESKIHRNWSIPVKKIEDQIMINVSMLIDDVQQNFTKNKACMDYVMKAIALKIKPNKKTGFYPLSISVPSEVGFLLTDEQRKLIIERVPQYLPHELVFIINDKKIRIV